MSEIELKESRPAYVKFERRVVQDHAASQAEGRYVGKEVDFALITPLYTRDVVIHRVSDWFVKLDADVANERIPPGWVQNYRKMYEAWKSGQELPLQGTPIRGWGVISPAQQEMLTRINILTVEDLADVTADGLARIGMGGVDLKNKAIAFIKSSRDVGKLVMENASLTAQMTVASQTIDELTKTVEELSAAVESLKKAGAPRETSAPAQEATQPFGNAGAGGGVDDFMPDDEPPAKPKGKARG